MLQIKRVYEKKSSSDGYRILVDRLWPRGVSKEEAHVSIWLKDVSPTPGLRKWFGHDPKKFPEFAKRYTAEIKQNANAVNRIKMLEKKYKTVTLLYGAKDQIHNNAVVLLSVLT